jgi:septal ring factor EnvC (AmiA/AmiB activator)
MTNQPTIRRSIVAIGLLVTVLAAVATMRGAAMWAATSASLDAPPVAVADLQRALADEQARSAALTDELDQLQAAAAGMHDALSAAEGQMTTDQATADELRTSLEAAQLRLANVEKALAAAKARLAAASKSGTTSAGGSSGGGYEDEHEHEHDDD